MATYNPLNAPLPTTVRVLQTLGSGGGAGGGAPRPVEGQVWPR